MESAKLLLETQLEYIERHQRLRASEDAMRRQLYEMVRVGVFVSVFVCVCVPIHTHKHILARSWPVCPN